MDPIKLFFIPQGRTATGPFWIGSIVLLVITTLLSAAQVYGNPAMANIIGLVSLVLIYPWVCVFVKRFHDSGKSGWLVILVILAYGILAGCASFFLIFAPSLQEMANLPPGSPEAQAFAMNLMKDNFITVTAATVAVSLVLTLLVGLLPSDPGENKFGPPTSGTTVAA